MVLKQNGRFDNQYPLESLGSALINDRAGWSRPGVMNLRIFGQGGISKTSAIPNGYTFPYCWYPAITSGGLVAVITCTLPAISANLAGGKNASATITCVSTMDAGLNAIGQLAATIYGTCTIDATGGMSALMTATLYGSSSMDASLGAIVSMLAELHGAATMDATLTGKGNISAEIYVNQSEATAQQIATVVWEDNTAQRILGLVQHNFEITDQVYENNRLTSATVNIYGEGTTPIGQYSITAVYDSDGNCIDYSVDKVL
jgi:hypothetical protein